MDSSFADFAAHFGSLPDPRRNNGQLRHNLIDILAIALCAMISGAEGFVEMEEYGPSKERLLREQLGLELPYGIPSHDTFARLFARLEPTAFEECFTLWTQEMSDSVASDPESSAQSNAQSSAPRIIALDGKTLRRSFDTATGQSALHLVSAWSSEHRLILAQQGVDEKSNEITAVPALLERLDINGCVVTSDALNTQKNIAAQIIDQGADYVLALKGNHGLLYEDARSYFEWLATRPGELAAGCEASWSTRD